jgi:hypothetical protein
MQQFMQQPELLCCKPIIHGADAGDVAAGPIEAGDDAGLDRVGAGHEHDWNSRRRRFGRKGAAILPNVAMTVTRRFTRSAANSGSRWLSPCAQRYSMRTLRPST